jgi:hypothetical protein
MKVAQMACDMNQALKILSTYGPNDTIQAFIDECEKQIRDVYRETFGTELGN